MTIASKKSLTVDVKKKQKCHSEIGVIQSRLLLRKRASVSGLDVGLHTRSYDGHRWCTFGKLLVEHEHN